MGELDDGVGRRDDLVLPHAIVQGGFIRRDSGKGALSPVAFC
jgi:hypothetical protein